MASFRETLRDAIKHFAARGYSSQAELDEWLSRLRIAMEREMPGEDGLRAEFETIFRRLTNGGLSARLPNADRYTLDRIMPELRAELDRRIHAAADLIKLNKKAAVEKTLQRFTGWSSSIPPGGVSEDTKRQAATHIGKANSQIRFEARRVAIDQGHKLSANVAHMAAIGSGAIAGEWVSHWRRPGYDYREDHKERDGKIYLIRDSWAHKEGLIKPGAAGYMDQITQPGQEPYCSCNVTYITSLRRLPRDMLTAKGLKALDKVI